MNKLRVSRALLMILLIIVLSACGEPDRLAEVEILPNAGVFSPSVASSEETAPAALGEQHAPDEPLTSQPGSSPAPLVHERTFIELYKAANPAVVNIQVTAEPEAASPEGGASPQIPELPDMPGFPSFPFPAIPEVQPMPRRGQGSGFMYDLDGHIITNNHVVASADEITVVFSDGTEVDATLIGADPDTDLAVIKVDDVDDGLLVPLKLADSSMLEVGQHVVAIGNPFGLSGSMTTGIISGLGRILPANASQFTIPDIVQTDAAINPGNSGGPLLNLQGEVVAVNTAIASPNRAFAGVGYAVPANTVSEVVPELIVHGSIQHPWLGITGRTLDRETAEAMDLEPDQRGVLIADVVAESPASESELHGSDTQVTIEGQEFRIGGDVVVGIEDRVVNDFDDLLSYIVHETDVGQTVTLHVLRDGEPLELEVTLGPRPASDE
jgi:S1-C subfamily serine protease